MSILPYMAASHLEDAAKLIQRAGALLDEACRSDMALCNRVNAIPCQDKLEAIAAGLAKLAIEVETAARAELSAHDAECDAWNARHPIQQGEPQWPL